MSHQSSRLHRLLTLLDSILVELFSLSLFSVFVDGLDIILCFFNLNQAGSTQDTRLTAAPQIGDIAKSQPQDLSSLLRKVF